jgi:hypothetical protein
VHVYPEKGAPFIELPMPLLDSDHGLPEIGVSVDRARFDYGLCVQSDAAVADQCSIEKFYESDGEISLILEFGNGKKEITAGYLLELTVRYRK